MSEDVVLSRDDCARLDALLEAVRSALMCIDGIPPNSATREMVRHNVMAIDKFERDYPQIAQRSKGQGSMSEKFFTVVFRGDVRKLGFNPMTAETAFGEVIGVSIGNLMEELDAIESTIERRWPEADDLIDAVRDIRAKAAKDKA